MQFVSEHFHGHQIQEYKFYLIKYTLYLVYYSTLLLSWNCKIYMVWPGLLMNIWAQHSYQSLLNCCLSPLGSYFFLLLSLIRPRPQLLPLQPHGHTQAFAHMHYNDTHTHTHEWCVGMEGVRPCWGAADWSCTDLPPAPWGFVTCLWCRVLTLSLTVFLSFCLSPVLSLCLSLSCWHLCRLLLCSAVASCSCTSHPSFVSVFCQ